MRIEDFDFELPEELIAQLPVEPRDHSRLLVLDKRTGDMEHKRFFDIIDYLKEGDVLVVNETKVIPARLFGVKKDTGAKFEVVLLTRKDKDTWEALVRPGKRAKVGTEIVFGEGLLKATVLGDTSAGGRVLKFSYEGVFEELLDRLGEMPLPPYITEKLEDKNRYQTVYAREEGSAAAPTAGLHFTPELIGKLEEKGVKMVKVLLHVGLGTFRPVQVDNPLDHVMHSEFYQVSPEAAEEINEARKAGGRIIAVGTTSTRTLESSVDDKGQLVAGSGWTDIYIYPGYQFKVIDGLITNFHLPKSTLIMLVSALAGRENILAAYKTAVDDRYRFFSFGDAMLIV